MASYIVHDLAGEQLLRNIQSALNINFSESEKINFLLGNLIPDSSKISFDEPKNLTPEELKEYREQIRISIQDEKVSTHFRNPSDSDLCIQAPNLSTFLLKYSRLIKKDISVLGYFFHLYTDKIFFDDLFCKTFCFFDFSNQPTIYQSKTSKLIIKKNGETYSLNDVLSPLGKASMYDDYTKINALMLKKHQIEYDFDILKSYTKDFINPGIEEVNYRNINSILDKTKKYVQESFSLKDYTLKVFDESVIDPFIYDVVNSFIDDYGYLFLEYKKS